MQRRMGLFHYSRQSPKYHSRFQGLCQLVAYKNKEDRNAYARKYHSTPEWKEYAHQYYAALSPEKKEAYRKSSDAWHETHRELDASRTASSRKFWRNKVLTKLGNRCNNPGCGWVNTDGTHGCTDPHCLQIDHVHGGGSKEVKACTAYYKKVFFDEDGNYQLLCANCNWIKRFVNKEHR